MREIYARSWRLPILKKREGGLSLMEQRRLRQRPLAIRIFGAGGGSAAFAAALALVIAEAAARFFTASALISSGVLGIGALLG